jgi:hypothetical protein
MKIGTILFLLTSVVSKVAAELAAGDSCQVVFKPQGKKGSYEEVEAFAGAGLCGGKGQDATDCNFHVGDTGDPANDGPFPGTCEPVKCEGNNGNKAPGAGSHRVTICHRTCSETNPWVRITIDNSAWGPNTDSCKHGPHHDVRDECNGAVKDITETGPWAPYYHDYLIRDHGYKGNDTHICILDGQCDSAGNLLPTSTFSSLTEFAKDYWKSKSSQGWNKSLVPIYLYIFH